SKQAGSGQVEVGQERFHGSPLGDFPDFIQVFLRAPALDCGNSLPLLPPGVDGSSELATPSESGKELPRSKAPAHGSTTQCFSGVGEFLIAAVVAARLDELLGGGEIGGGRFPRILLRFVPSSGFRVPSSKKAGAVKVNVRQEKSHGAALGDFPGFVQ